MPLLAALLALLAACALTAFPDPARATRAGSMLPPGQSGFIGPDGPSPHLTDQIDPFVRFELKPAELGLPGVRSEEPRPGVTIARDRFGVPRITGNSEEDAWWGAGYAVAQDRLVQLELFRRSTSGTLAAVLGEDRLAEDIVARRDYYTELELRRQLQRLPLGLRRRLQAHADGINVWLGRVREDPALTPREFSLLGLQPEPWTVLDSIRVGVQLARTVPSSDGNELINASALRSMGPRGFSALVPLRSRNPVVTVPRSEGAFPSQPGRTRAQERAAYARSQRFVRRLPLPRGSGDAAAAARPGRSPTRGGSNAWAVRGDGGAYLFNGPQLGFSLPELFVELEVEAPGYHARGVTAPGIPIVAVGHNGRVAWGVTSGLTDDDDLYAEQLAGSSERYRYKGKVRRMSCRTERFEVAGESTVRRRLCRTVHGPVQERAGRIAYARRYAIWGRELQTFPGLDAIGRARSLREVEAGVRQFTWNENLMAADAQGNIGWWHPGLLPLRPTNYDERLPYPGTGEAEWRGFLSYRQWPKAINPRRGWLASWNNLPSVGWTNGDSPADERLAGPLHRNAYLERLVAGAAREPGYERVRDVDRAAGTTAQQRPLVEGRLQRAAAGASAGAAAVLGTLLAWDGDYATTDAAGTVDPGVAAWDEFRAAAEGIALGRLGRGASLVAGSPSRSHVFDVTNGQAYALRTLDARGYRRAAERAFVALQRRFGTADPAAWREPRRQYDVTVQGVADKPELPFFDRGTWQQMVELRP